MSAATLEPTFQTSFNALAVFALEFEAFIAEVERWDELTEQRREVFTGLAYKLLDHPHDPQSHIQSAVGATVLGVSKVLQNDWLMRFQKATYNFVRITLDQIERSNPQYQTDVATALTEALEDIKSGNTVTLTTEKEIRDYLRKTSEVGLY